MKQRALEPAPRTDWQKSQLTLHDAMDLARDPQLRNVLRKADEDYLYWDKFKYLSLPEGLSHEVAWSLLKLTRSLDRRDTPVLDVHGHTFWYSLTPEVLRCLHVIGQRAGGSVGMQNEGIPETQRKRFLVNSIMEEAIASSQIEGASTTTRVAKDMLRAGREPEDHAERMILNNYRTMQDIKEYTDEPLTPKLIRGLQESITRGTLDDENDAGRFRQPDDDVVVADGSRLEVLHTPPAAGDIPGELQRLCDYANRDGSEFEDPVLKATVLHFWLAYLHPFIDGNGRTARALFYRHMLKQGYPLFEYLAISRVILGKRGQYDKAYLYSETDDCDMTYFITFNLHAIEQAIEGLHEYVMRKSEEDARLQRSLRRHSSLNHRQRAALIRALKDPDVEMTIESHASSHDVAYATARSDLYALAEEGYLEQFKRGRRYVFIPATDLRLKIGRKSPSTGR